MSRSSSNQHDVAAIRGVANGGRETLQVQLLGRMMVEAVAERDRLFVQQLHVGFGHLLQPRRLVQQLAIQQLPAQGCCQLLRQFTASSAMLAGDRDDSHANRPPSCKRRSTR